MEKFKKGIILVVCIAGAGLAALVFLKALPLVERDTVVIGDVKVAVTIARTAEEMARGLSGTKTLKEGMGMLFIYEKYTTPQFWMKDMNYSIDIIWIRDDRVTGFVENAPVPVSGQELPRYQPNEPINYVLEVPAGFVTKYGITQGAVVRY